MAHRGASICLHNESRNRFLRACPYMGIFLRCTMNYDIYLQCDMGFTRFQRHGGALKASALSRCTSRALRMARSIWPDRLSAQAVAKALSLSVRRAASLTE